jgi:hypothetical protein
LSKVPHNDDTQDDSVPTYYLVDESTGRIRFTAAGKQAFRRRFARAGITFEYSHARPALGRPGGLHG